MVVLKKHDFDQDPTYLQEKSLEMTKVSICEMPLLFQIHFFQFWTKSINFGYSDKKTNLFDLWFCF